MPKAVFLNIYYDQFLKGHYERNPGLRDLSYAEQLASIQGMMFGDSDFYSFNLRKVKGWDAVDIITNCEPLQRRWAYENGVPFKNGEQVLIEQIYVEAPEVVYTQGLWVINERVYEAIRPLVKIIIGQCGSYLDNFEAPRFDMIFTCIGPYVERFREAGTEAHYLGLAFDPRVLRLPLNGCDTYSVTFIGGLTGNHRKRRQLIQYLCRELEINCWGYGYEGIETNTLRCYRGEAWGPKMFSLLRHSYITVNCAIDFHLPIVGNMRTYEATGCGALLITDCGMNLPDLFDVGTEVVAYENPEDCLVKIKYYLGHREEGDRIAKAGHARTMKDHTYEKRMRKVAQIMEARL